jgi:hypothetical protein
MTDKRSVYGANRFVLSKRQPKHVLTRIRIGRAVDEKRQSRMGYDIYAVARRSGRLWARAQAAGVKSLICQLVAEGSRAKISRR